MSSETALRQLIARSLAWGDARVTFEKAVDAIPAALRGGRIEGFPHSLWQLLEHMRLTQADILAFCRPGDYAEPVWPEDYWPAESEAPGQEAWDRSIASFVRDRAELQALAADESLDLISVVPHGTDQTYLRELLLVVDHSAYHIGQIVALRQALGIWR